MGTNSLTALRAHKWSIASLALTSALLVLQQVVGHHFKAAPGSFESWPLLGKYFALLGWGELAAAAFSIMGLAKEVRPWLSLVALLIAAFLLFAWGYSA